MTCPDPYLGPGTSLYNGPWADGSFSVILNDSAQNYEYIKVRSDSFFPQTFHDDFTINGLRGGTYNIVSRGTNGCEVTQQVTIIQPDEWYYVYEEPTPATCSSLGSISVDSLRGGTQPFHYHWTYFLDTNLVFPDTSVIFGDTGIYNVDIIDANGCVYMNSDFMWLAIDRVDTDRVYLTYYETVPIGDTAELINAPDSITFCRANDYFFNAMSLGHGCEDCDTIYSWSDNFYGREEAQNHDPVSVSGWLTVHFTDQNGCPSADSIYIDIYIPEFNILGISDSILNDSIYGITISPTGGTLIFNEVEIPLDNNGNGLLDLNGLNPGTYQIDYSGEFGPLSCFDEFSWTFEVQQKVRIDEYSNKFSIYPNPASNILNIEFNGEFSGDIQLFDMTGRLLKTTENLSEITSIDVSDLASGVYFIHFVSESGCFTKKFVKK